MSDELDNRIDDLLALAALGELSPADEAELDAALLADADLTAEIDADLAVAALLQSTLAVDPPATLKSGVMAAISEPARSEPARSEPAQSDVVDFGAARAKRKNRWQPLAAAAAVVMLLAGGILVANRGGGDDGSNFEAIAAADDAQQRALAGTLEGTLDVVYSPSQNAFVLVGSGIPTLIDEETYQLWFVDDEGAQPIGLFRPDDTGRVEQVFEGLDPSDIVVGVTIEPAAGSDAPTLPIIANT